jgi:hypothetical protein
MEPWAGLAWPLQYQGQGCGQGIVSLGNGPFSRLPEARVHSCPMTSHGITGPHSTDESRAVQPHQPCQLGSVAARSSELGSPLS